MSARARAARRVRVAAALTTGAVMLAACSAIGPVEVRRDRTATDGSQAIAGSVANPTGGGEAGDPVALETDHHRRSDGVVAEGGAGAPYNYTPTVMRDGDDTRMWWCSQYNTAYPAGDDIVYGVDAGDRGETGTGGRFTGPGGGIPEVVFSGDPGSFDGKHTCDPSVIKVDGVYYLYYTGADGDHDFVNAIGLATSEDGRTWRRAGGGEPILRPARDVTRDNTYGAGQPAVAHVDGWFYLVFTDTTGFAAGWNGAGQFVLRSTDPAFGSGVEALGPDGFVPVEGTEQLRAHAVLDAFSVDLMWVDVLDAFAVAHQTAGGTSLTFFDRDFSSTPYEPVVIEGPWQEGPGLVRTPQGHAPRAGHDPCGTVPVDVIRATRDERAPTDLRRFGLDITGVEGCGDQRRAGRVLDGYAMPSPERTMDLVVDGALVRVERRAVAEQLAERVLDERPERLAELPVAARLDPGAPVLYSPNAGRGVLLDDGRLWPLSTEQATRLRELNDSAGRTIGDSRWSAYPEGASFR
ncbi:beta-xylosidase [Haloechinothrix sp. YIM 98757]|uniref:Beta-xylosidase n=1 Tax=Haloechinothrix aidingensis TaxID=2752311 RepID=A0A838AA57_9PSEU|nr:beta-xylosidase [Haloechinothrix aidingensis]MBA0125989.1 beta-xylosidase [Haloechinothrix aidingensis]